MLMQECFALTTFLYGHTGIFYVLAAISNPECGTLYNGQAAEICYSSFTLSMVFQDTFKSLEGVTVVAHSEHSQGLQIGETARPLPAVRLSRSLISGEEF